MKRIKIKAEELQYVTDLIDKATQAANEAGDKWVAENTKPRFALQQADLAGNKFGPIDYMLDVCGFAYINFKDKRSRFYKIMREFETGERMDAGDDYSYRYYNFLHINHKYRSRQEMGLAEACMRAAAKVIIEAGHNEIYVTSRID